MSTQQTGIGISIADVSTGDYLVTEVDNQRKLLDEIYKFTPTEIICNESFLYERRRYRGPERAVWDSGIYGSGGLVF